MIESLLQILSPGTGCRIVSSPQQGFRDLGVASGGAIDIWSAQKANILVGNANFDPCIEIPYGPIKILISKPCLAAIVGYGFYLRVNGENRPLNYSLSLTGGDEIEILNTQSSGTSYLAFRGGVHSIDNDHFVKNHHLFQISQTIPTPIFSYKGVRPEKLTPSLRVLPGPEIGAIEKNVVTSFFDSSWRIDRSRNRMGVRLFSTDIVSMTKSMPSLRSHAVVPGTLQMSDANSCIALMADCQTTGGYPRIASIIEADLWKLAQLPVDTKITFSMCEHKVAISESLKNTYAINRLSYASNRQRNLR